MLFMRFSKAGRFIGKWILGKSNREKGRTGMDIGNISRPNTVGYHSQKTDKKQVTSFTDLRLDRGKNVKMEAFWKICWSMG
jgi:hypothetical protein